MLQGEPLTILLVEDNNDHAELVRRSLAKHKIANKIYHVTDGQAALNYLFREGAYSDPRTSPLPDLVLLDLRLPKVDGLDVLKRLKDAPDLRRIPVVIMTTSDAETDVAVAYERHANSYVVKPLGLESFRKMMTDLGFYWLAWNVNPWSGDPE